MPKNCPRISVRIHVEFWLGLDARKFICRKPKWKIRLKISHRTCSIRDPTIFELSELNWRACQLTCSLNIHHKHIRQYHLLSIASFLSTRFIKDLHQTLTSVRCPHRLTRTYLHQKFIFIQTLTYTPGMRNGWPDPTRPVKLISSPARARPQKISLTRPRPPGNFFLSPARTRPWNKILPRPHPPVK